MNQGKYKELIESFYKELRHVQSDTLGEKKPTTRASTIKKRKRRTTTKPIYNPKTQEWDT